MKDTTQNITRNRKSFVVLMCLCVFLLSACSKSNIAPSEQSGNQSVQIMTDCSEEQREIEVAAESTVMEHIAIESAEMEHIAIESAEMVHLTEASIATAEKNYVEMNVFFATDRKEDEQTNNSKKRFGSKLGELKYGITKVSIPNDHRAGEMEAPSIWRLEFRENPVKHVVLLKIDILDKSSYYKTLAEEVNKSTKKSAFIFIHGFKVTFEDAARRTAQISYDLKFDGAAVFYSWPSHGSKRKYWEDNENILRSQKNIKRFLEDFANKSDAENIFLIAHSMGNVGLTGAYLSLIRDNPELKSRFKEIILAAPDIDAEVFKRDIAPAMVQSGNPITLYVSSKDIALNISNIKHNGPRAGDSGKNIVLIPGIETIDSTKVKGDLLGHSYYAAGPVLKDMSCIFKNHNLRASERNGLNSISSGIKKYWEIKSPEIQSEECKN